MRTVGDITGTLTIASLVVVVVLWLQAGNIRDFGVLGGAATALARLAGLLSSDLLLIQVLLMARIPWVERVWGQDELTRRHRLLGFTSFWMMCLHIIGIIVGYAQAAHEDLLVQGWNLLVDYPGMLLAGAGTVAILAVVVTSIRHARRRIRYSSWHLIHLYAYLGVGLALPHQVWTGADFIGNAWARAYWWALYAAVAASVLGFRVALPLARSWRHRLTVTKVVQEGPGVVSVYLGGRHLDQLGVRAGQFFLWRFVDGTGSSRAHPFSLSAPPHTGELRITAKSLGTGSARLAALKPGTRALVEGPYGRLTGAVRTQRRLVFITAGIGITPMRALLEELDYGPGEATLIHRTRGPHDVVFAQEITDLARDRSIRVLHLPGPRNPLAGTWAPAGHSSSAAALLELAPDLATSDVYLCGPDDWMRAVRTTARAAGVPARQIHSEYFSY
ncbi:MAG: ferredoxin reductase family protein [Actinomycetota bacterium]|nr:ferredoxin reductase family protein [Actinomycetota bacterium]